MKNFESLLSDLEKIVKELESGELPLEDAINKYKKGVELCNSCKNKLVEAKEIIIKVMDEGK